MILIIGPSGSGKDKLLTELTKFGYKKLVTYTSRAPRKGEIHGESYYFVNKNEFEKLIQDDFFAEYTLYDGYCYGIPRSSIEDNAVCIVEPNGFRKLKDDAVSIYVSANTDVQVARMASRGDDIKDIVRRTMNDKKMFEEVIEECDIVFNNNEPITKKRMLRLQEAIKAIQKNIPCRTIRITI